MKSNSITFEKIHDDYCGFIDSCHKFNCFTRSQIFQKEKIVECEQHILYVKSFRYQAKEKENEYEANHFFHMQCMINAMRSSLLMWVELKADNFNKAWNHLIDAQDYTGIALKVSDYEGVRNLEKKLICAEKSLFPGWAMYNSPGFTETIGDCSICKKKFTTCIHIEGNIYCGSLCYRINRKIIDVDHSALVKHPKDKRCVITEISGDDGKMINYFTWEKTGESNEGEDNRLRAVIFNYGGLDLS